MDNDDATVNHLLLPENVLRDNYGATVRRVVVNFMDERGDLLRQALSTTVPRIGEEVELIIAPTIDQVSKLDLPKMSGFQALKSLLGFRDKVFDKAIEKVGEEADALYTKVYNGTVLRVKWQWFVQSPDGGVTIATVVLKLAQDGSFRADR